MTTPQMPERIIAGDHSFTLYPYDPDYTGFKLIIWMHATGGGACTSSYYGCLVQKKVDAALHNWRSSITLVDSLPKDARFGFFQCIVRIRPSLVGQNLDAPAVYERLIEAYTAAITAVDLEEQAYQAHRKQPQG